MVNKLTDKDILDILRKEVRYDIETIETRRMDSLDFYDVHIASLVNVVRAAHERGKVDGALEVTERFGVADKPAVQEAVDEWKKTSSGV